MATPTLAPERRRAARLLLRIVLGLLAVVLLAAGGGIWLFLHTTDAALPQLDGSVHVDGLSAPVTVIRDSHGVPHITAATMADLLFAQGYVTAQDRLWQMDMTRRFTAGELAEVLGARYVKSDRMQRTLGMRQAAQRAAAVMAPEDRTLLDAYARGVNAFMESHPASLPIEFRLLGYAPRPWTAEDSLLIGAMFNEMLNLYYVTDELAREKVTTRLPPELAADLFPNISWRDHPPRQTEPPFEPPAKESQSEESRNCAPDRNSSEPTALEIGEQLVAGSNNWVVSGAHTVSGEPLLSNDMHLQHHIPNVWYEVHLTAGDFDVAGVNSPGLPLVQAGHNRRIAWGFTNIGPAVTDLYVENFNSAGQYETPQGWQAPERRHEVIHVHRQPDESFDVLLTRHGPILSDVLAGETRKLSLKWTLYDPRELSSTVQFFRQVAVAQNWEEFRRAAAEFGGPGQNIVYADVDGHIGYQATGWIPQRAAGDATKPVPGNVDTYEWTGYLPFEKMPSVFDPQSGVIATANGRVTPDGYPYFITSEWMPPYRQERIYRVLQSGKKFSPSDMLALQTDIDSDVDRYFAQRFAYSVDHAKAASARAKAAAEILRQWDGRVRADSAAPTIVSRSRRRLMALLLEPYLGRGDEKSNSTTGWRQYSWHSSDVWLENLLSRQPARWLPKEFKTWDDLLVAAVETAVAEKDAPNDVSRWTWSSVAPLYIQHPIFGGVPMLRRWTGPGWQPQSGDGTTVKQVGRDFGPSERMTVDFSDLDASTLNIVTGQSGNFRSPYYMDQWPAWYGGTTFRLPFSPDAVEKARAHRLTLSSQ
ncbi:MAG: penicillin acylase family protein [Terriglobales bacterium]